MQIVQVFNDLSSREEKDQHSEAALSKIIQRQQKNTAE